MRKYFIVFLLLHMGYLANAQQLFPTVTKDDNEPKYLIELNEAVVVAPYVFANDTDRYHYNQLRYYIKSVMPYVNASVKIFNEINTQTAGMNKKNRKRYIKTREKEIKENFEDKLASLNITQGRLLVKLINRKLKTNCYSILKDLKNPVTAAYYQTWAKLNGINLNEDYKPEENRDIERIMRGIEK